MRIDGPQITGSFSLNGDGVQDLDVFATTASVNDMITYMATTGSNTFVGTQTISGSIIPSVNDTYDLGSPTHQFRHVYISSGSLYIDGTKVLGSTSQELQITTDGGQSFKILEAGSDTITLQSADGNITLASSGGGDIILDPTNGIVALKGTVTVYSGNKVVSSDGNSIHFGDGIVISGSLLSTGTALVSGSEQIVYSDLSGLPSNIISGSEQLSTLGIATTGSNTFNGNLTVNGYIDTQELRTTFISSSILYRSGSTKFGDESTDTHSFTGSLNILGDLGNNPVTLEGDTSSNAWLRLKSGLTNTTYQIGASTGSFFIVDEVNNANRFVVTNNGNIAVGPNTPTVFGSGMEIKTGAQTGLRLSSTTAGGGAIEIGADSTTGYIQNIVVGDKTHFYVSNTTPTDTIALTISPNGKIGIGDSDPDNTYQGLTIKGENPSVRLKTTGSSGWTWIEYVNNSGTNTWSSGVNHTTSYFAIKSGAGLDSPNFKMNTGGLIEIGRTSAMTTQSDFDYKSLIIKTGFGAGYTSGTIQSFLAGYDGDSIHGVDLGYAYMGSDRGYSLDFSTNDNLTGNPIHRMRLDDRGYLGINRNEPSFYLDVKAEIADSFYTIAQFENRDYTAGTRTFIRVRNWLSANGSFSSYFGQGQDGKTYIIANDSSRGGDIIIDGTNGQVGINKSPAYTFDVGGGSAFRDTLRVLANDVNAAHLSWTSSNTGLLNLYHGGTLTTQIVANGSSYFNGGSVGINTNTPGAKLEVKASGDEDLIIGRYSGGSAKLFYVYQSSADGFLELRTGADNTITKLSGYSGTPSYFLSNVGFGVDVPDSSIEVGGRMSIRGANRLYWGQTTTSYGSWTTAQYASGSSHIFNAQQFIFTNEGYGSTEFFRINSSGYQTGFPLTSTSTQPFIFHANGNTDTYTKSSIYVHQNNVSGNLYNGIFIERGRITNTTDGEIKRMVIGARGGQAQFVFASQNMGIGVNDPQQRLSVGGSISANRVIYSWFTAGTNDWDGYQYLHLKTNMWAGGSPNGNVDYTMSLFYGRMYSYTAYVREGYFGFHNWSGTFFSPATSGNFWQGGYTSTDGYVVLVVALGGGNYMGVSIDWYQAYGYPFRSSVVTGYSPSNSTSGVY